MIEIGPNLSQIIDKLIDKNCKDPDSLAYNLLKIFEDEILKLYSNSKTIAKDMCNKPDSEKYPSESGYYWYHVIKSNTDYIIYYDNSFKLIYIHTLNYVFTIADVKRDKSLIYGYFIQPADPIKNPKYSK